MTKIARFISYRCERSIAVKNDQNHSSRCRPRWHTKKDTLVHTLHKNNFDFVHILKSIHLSFRMQFSFMSLIHHAVSFCKIPIDGALCGFSNISQLCVVVRAVASSPSLLHGHGGVAETRNRWAEDSDKSVTKKGGRKGGTIGGSVGIRAYESEINSIEIEPVLHLRIELRMSF